MHLNYRITVSRAALHRLGALPAFTLWAVAALASHPAAAQDDPADLWQRAVLYRDDWGVPHIFADDVRAMAFAFGYAQAEDHVEDMLLAFRFVNGRVAEILGPGYAESDRFAIRMGHTELARRAISRADPVTRDLCEGFAIGVNSWLVDNAKAAPAWAEGMNPSDTLALLHAYLMSQAPFDLSGAYRPAQATPRANVWAAGPGRSQSGNTILVMNPHGAYEGPFRWTEAHLSIGDYTVYGATLFGLPVLMQGHNEHLGWALAPNRADTADIYFAARRTVGRPREVPLADRVTGRAFSMSDPEIVPFYVWNGTGYEEHYVYRLLTGNGPLVHQGVREDNYWRVGGYGEFGAMRQFFDMGRARDLAAFQAALEYDQLSSFHLVYADSAGNTYYRYCARTGEKAPLSARDRAGMGYTWDGPVPAGDSTFAWGSAMPYAGMPTLTNPDRGYIQACDTPPWRVTGDTGTDPADWPEWLIRDPDSFRARRLRRLLEFGPRSFHENHSLLYDTVVPAAADAAPAILRAAQAFPGYVAEADPDLPACLDLVRNWNFLADVDSSAMTFFHVWWSSMERTYGTAASGTNWDDLFHEQPPALLQAAIEQASESAKLVRNQFQSIDVPWGNVHRIVRGSRDEPVPGGLSGGALFGPWDSDFEDGRWRARGGPAFAMAIEFREQPEAVSIVPFGASESPDSPHYDDQLDLLLDHRFKRTWFERTDVEANAESAVGRRLALRSPDKSGVVYLQAAAPIRAWLDRTAVDPAAIVPAGARTFGAILRPVLSPPRPSTAYLEFRVEEDVCARQNLPQLAVYALANGRWDRLPSQDFIADTRTFRAHARAGEAFAVLGDARLHRGGGPAPVPEQSGEAKRYSQRVTSAVPRKPAPLMPSEALRTQAPARQQVARKPAAEDPSAMPGDASLPELDPRLEAALDAVPELVPGQRPVARDARSEPVRNRPDPAVTASPAPASRPPAQPITAEEKPEPESAARPAEPATVEQQPSTQPAPAEVPFRVSRRPDGVPVVRGSGEVPVVRGSDARKPDGVRWTNQTPGELRAMSGDFDKPFVLNPDTKNSSPIRIGKQMQLRPPGNLALFTLSADDTIRARVKRVDNPPAAFPEGLVRFSPVYEVIAEPATARGLRVGYRIQVEPGLVTAGNFPKLHVYVYDRGEGWGPLATANHNPDTQSITGIDLSGRMYVILGPANHRLKPPTL